MAWQDRHYYRDSGSGARNPLMWLLTGSVPLFTIFGIRVRAHAALLVFIGLVLLFGLGRGSTFQDRFASMSILFGIILLHEFGHCFAARWTGGSADDILLTPLGGLAMTMARRRPWPTFVTVAGGPLVNVIICLISGVALAVLDVKVPLNPFGFSLWGNVAWLNLAYYLNWIYFLSYILLLFNLLPIFPLDGGQLLQSILWQPLGYFRSMMITMNVGLVGSVLLFAFGLAKLGSGGGLLIVIIAAMCFINCFQMRAMLKAEGPWAFQDEDSIDYTSSLYEVERKPSRWRVRRAERRAAKLENEERAERERIDRILEKVSAHGMHSLSWWERRALRKATEHQRQRDLELGRARRI
jgi:Zn-dependent protease